jgi:uncharacterized protein (DUF2236 family)
MLALSDARRSAAAATAGSPSGERLLLLPESAAAAVSGCSVWLACCAVGLVAALLLQLLAPDVTAAPFCKFCSFLHSCLCCGHALRWQA